MRTLLLLLLLACYAYSAEVSGILRDVSGAGVDGGVVKLTAGTGVERTAKTNHAGAYSFTGLAPGRYQLVANIPGFHRVSPPAFELREGESKVFEPAVLQLVDFALYAVFLGGLVQDSDGKPIADAEVTVVDRGKTVRVRTSDKGWFLFQTLPYGEYLVWVEKNGFEPVQTKGASFEWCGTQGRPPDNTLSVKMARAAPKIR